MSYVEISDGADGVAVFTIQRPEKKNALSIEVRDELSDALDAVAGDDAISAAVLTGSGDTFSAGFDLDEFERLDDEKFAAELWSSSDRFHRTCLEFPLPLVAAVNGPALAGGFDLAVMCDLRVMADTAWFAHPELRFTEIVYGPLHELVGGGLARDLALTGRRIDADEARRVGLATLVTSAATVVDDAIAVASGVAAAPRPVLARMKQKIVSRARVVGDRTLDL